MSELRESECGSEEGEYIMENAAKGGLERPAGICALVS